jgi:F1F0 ATPase subunit 2
MMREAGVKLMIFLALGALFGAAYLGALEWNVRLYCRGSSTPFAAMIHALRLLGAGAIFVAIAQAGAAPLLSASLGFQCVRIFAVGAKRWSSEALS